jgi:hypothetical protein
LNGIRYDADLVLRLGYARKRRAAMVARLWFSVMYSFPQSSPAVLGKAEPIAIIEF